MTIGFGLMTNEDNGNQLLPKIDNIKRFNEEGEDRLFSIKQHPLLNLKTNYHIQHLNRRQKIIYLSL